MSRLRKVLKVAAWVPVVILAHETGFTVVTVSGRSMQPSLNPDSSMMDRDLVLLNRFVAVRAEAGKSVWKPGDVVALTSPSDPDTLLMKRIIGLPGSIVSLRPPHRPGVERFVRVPAGRCWVEGDEGFHSRDSTDFGPVPLGLLKARVECIVWPISRWGQVPPSKSGWEKRVVHPVADRL